MRRGPHQPSLFDAGQRHAEALPLRFRLGMHDETMESIAWGDRMPVVDL